ncbi:MAG: tetratricopeptide repeat protein, partial [Planctomycetaceae bacterium]
VLARYPRPMWSETIYEFANDPHSEVAAEALAALVRIGHPQLLDVFRRALAEGNASLKTTAFGLLAQRTDPQSEELAMGYVLEHLKSSPPDATMHMLLNRTKDRRAVPLLLEQMKKGRENRAAIVNTLAQIGDQSVVQEFVTLYPSLADHEKSSVLTALAQLKSPEFRRLAKEALASGNDALINTASQGLQSDGSAEAVQMLVDVFESTANQSTLSYVSNALGTLGTPLARNALLKARNSEDVSKRQYAVNALRNMRYRSPGMNLVHRANYRTREQKWDEAIKEYTLAIKLDSDLPEAYTGRANALIRLNKYADAKSDYVKARELDPYDSQAVTGAGLCLAIEGSYEEGIKIVEGARETFKDDQLFAYNAACVYGRAVEHLTKNDKIADREKKIEAFQQKAVEDLQSAVKLGFGDFKWMQEDPDLVPLHDLPGFKKLHGSTPGAPERAKESLPPDAVPKL